MIEIAKEKRFLTLTITFQKGQIERIHTNESYTLETLPVKDKARVEQLRAAGTVTREAVERELVTS